MDSVFNKENKGILSINNMFIQKEADHREECWLVPKTKAFFTI